jgi:hypothetical protein
MKIKEILESKPMTITGVGQKGKAFNSDKAQAIVDPRGYFAKNKRSIKKRKLF